jgi:hypothetical protein
MKGHEPTPIDATIVAVPETAVSALYGMLDLPVYDVPANAWRLSGGNRSF